MNKLLKISSILAGACVTAGIAGYASLVISAKAQPLVSTNAPTDAVAPAKLGTPASQRNSAENIGWVFRLSGTARDDPESGRQLTTTIEFLGTVQQCDPLKAGRGGHALGIDGSGQVAKATRESQVCVPGCPGVQPPAANTVALPRSLQLSAFQGEFDRAPSEYAAQGMASTVSWQCGTRAGRVVAAAVVALACNAEDCTDDQLVNAAVFLGTETGARLAEARAFFALRSTSRASLIGSAVIP